MSCDDLEVEPSDEILAAKEQEHDAWRRTTAAEAAKLQQLRDINNAMQEEVDAMSKVLKDEVGAAQAQLIRVMKTVGGVSGARTRRRAKEGGKRAE